MVDSGVNPYVFKVSIHLTGKVHLSLAPVQIFIDMIKVFFQFTF